MKTTKDLRSTKLADRSPNPRLKRRKLKNDLARFQKMVDREWRHFMNGRHDWAMSFALRSKWCEMLPVIQAATKERP